MFTSFAILESHSHFRLARDSFYLLTYQRMRHRPVVCCRSSIAIGFWIYARMHGYSLAETSIEAQLSEYLSELCLENDAAMGC